MSQNDTAFGIYIHIPFCLQKCGYCDFATRPFYGARVDDYVDLLCLEITSRAPTTSWQTVPWQTTPWRTLNSIYFGGGTPSLLKPEQLIKIKNTILKAGFQIDNSTEITIEINPGTLKHENLKLLHAEGFNRFSLGGQTFNNALLKACGREHTAQQTTHDLKMLADQGLNYSFDLLFALPQQSLHDVEKDLNQLLVFKPPHLSAYCLTLPKGHRMNARRARGSEQVKMFQLIEQRLKDEGVQAYEVSNFARPGFESRHNTLYWTGGTYWGIGLSAHSYIPPHSQVNNKWGLRFWNSKNLKHWAQQIKDTAGNKLSKKLDFDWALFDLMPPAQREHLQLHEAMSDFCHTRLRRRQGFTQNLLQQSFPAPAVQLIENRLADVVRTGLVEKLQLATTSHTRPACNTTVSQTTQNLDSTTSHTQPACNTQKAATAAPEHKPHSAQKLNTLWRLSPEGVMLSDQVFEALTFLHDDLNP